MAETKITSLLIPYEINGKTQFAQPNTIKVNTEEEGYPENYIELREVKNDEGEVIWGKYDWLIEDDDGQATLLAEIAENPDRYTKWSNIFDTTLSGLNVHNGSANLAETVFGMPNIQTLDIKNILLNSGSTNGSNYYYSDALTASPTVREGFYIGANATSSSWGATQKYYLNLRDSKSPLKDYILETTSLLDTLAIYPKYGKVKTSTLTSDCSSLDLENMSYLYTENPLYTAGYSYNYNGITDIDTISIEDKTFKFGSNLKVTYKYLDGTANKDWLIPQENISYTYNLNRTEYDKNTDIDHYLMAPNKPIKFPLEVSYPLYLKETPKWTKKTENNSSTSGDQGTLTSTKYYQLDNANLSLNPLVIDTLGVEGKEIRVTLRSDYKGFCAGTATDITTYKGRQNTIDTHSVFYNSPLLSQQNVPMIEGISTAAVSFKLNSDEATNNIYTNYPNLSTNPWDKKEGYLQVAFPYKCTYQEVRRKTQTTDSSADDPYAISTLGLEGGTVTPDPDINIPGIGGGGTIGPVNPGIGYETVDVTYYRDEMPGVCYLTYSWDNKLYYVDYINSKGVTPLALQVGTATPAGGTYTKTNSKISVSYLSNLTFTLVSGVEKAKVILPQQIENLNISLVIFGQTGTKFTITTRPLNLSDTFKKSAFNANGEILMNWAWDTQDSTGLAYDNMENLKDFPSTVGGLAALNFYYSYKGTCTIDGATFRFETGRYALSKAAT